MKYEWKKAQKAVYGVNQSVSLADIPEEGFIMLDGQGDPNAEDFSQRVSALYSLAYAIKMRYKKASQGQDFDDFTVYPLEGIWRQKEQGQLVKSDLIYTIMIGQPDFISPEMVAAALEEVKVKKPNPYYEEIRFERVRQGKSVSVLHVGSFDEEPASFAKLADFCQKENLQRRGDWHREIYLSNRNRTAPEKLKTILRYPVQ